MTLVAAATLGYSIYRLAQLGKPKAEAILTLSEPLSSASSADRVASAGEALKGCWHLCVPAPPETFGQEGSFPLRGRPRSLPTME